MQAMRLGGFNMKYTYTKEKRDPQIQWYKTESGKRWRVKFSVVRKGKRHYIQQNGLKSFTDAQLAKAQLLTELDNNTSKKSENLTVHTYWKRYSKLKERNGEWRTKTRKNAHFIFDKFILPEFGKTYLADINRLDSQEWLNSLADERDLSKSTIQAIIIVFKALLTSAVYDEFIDRNPLSRIKATGRPPRDQSITREDYNTIIEFAFNGIGLSDRNRAMLVLALHGMRRGEIAGMKLKYVSPTSISVQGQMNDFGEYGVPKTKTSVRDIPLMPGAYEILSKAISSARQQLAINESRIMSPDDFIFLNTKNVAIHPGEINRVFKYFSESTGIKIWPHKLRHAFSTFAFSTPGVNPKDIANILGHKNIEMSLDYNTGTDSGKTEAMNTLSSQFK